MNHLATSKEDILAASRELIKENGWTAVSIRAVASRCSVSAGTIYNYYESKADLLGDTIESIYAMSPSGMAVRLSHKLS